MTVTIRPADLVESVAYGLQLISYYHPCRTRDEGQLCGRARGLGMEAIYEFEVQDFPFTVAVDSDDRNVHALARSSGGTRSRASGFSRPPERRN
jgi:hypothetical protein